MRRDGHGGGGPLRVAGCDLGKSAAKLIVAEIGGAGELRVLRRDTVVHEGRPMEAFRAWYEREGVAGCVALGATGLHADELVAPAISGLPEDACLQAALPVVPELASGPLNLVIVGARGYSVLTRSADGRITWLASDKCSSGTGETMVKIAGRFGLGIEEADRLAAGADEVIPITARCSVFAKSEMTHFGNQGRPAEALFKGYFGSVASYTAALLARARVDGPVWVVGGGALLGSFVAALSDVVGQEVHALQAPRHLEALGATLLAAEQARHGALAPLPADPDGLVRPKARRFVTLEPARTHAERVTRMPAPAIAEAAATEPSILGIDLGSTGSKAVLTSLASGEAVLDLYDRTRGNPVDATRRLIEALLARIRPDVRAIGLTGSGREAAATVVRAAFPDLAERIVVINEIVAHATAAIRCDPSGGADLSVVEIGGQDAKFIRIVGGQIVESDMNKACSAGTGSFLEEQAVFYGVHDIERFTAMAQRAERPPDLGQMCTVFVADAAAEALGEGYALEDLFGGFQYSVIQNYINRVMGQRTFGRTIFFQGKPATGPSLGWTLAAVTGRDVVVPPNPGAMGAWGIGLCATEALGREALEQAPAFDLRAVLGAEVVGRAEFQCKDKRCATLCNIERTKVAVGGTTQTVLSGGACPKYEIAAGPRAKLPREAPSAPDEREALLERWLVDTPGDGGPVVGVPLVGATFGVMPWLVTLARELGFGVRILRSDARSLSRGEERCYSFDACAPIKIAHGALDADVDTVLLPKLLTLGDRDGACGKTCPMEQALPEMVQEALAARGRQVRFVRPALALDEGLMHPKLVHRLYGALVDGLGADPKALLPAMRAAAEAQRAWDEGLEDIGRRTLSWARAHGVPVVVVCGALHVIHDPGVNAGIPRLLRDNGVLALPMDCYPIPAGVDPLDRLRWADARRALRVALAARAAGDVYPLMLTSFGCGPGSFNEQIFAELMRGYPHTALESDGHGGTAGYVTRVQAFLHTVRQHDRRPSPASRAALDLVQPLPDPALGDERGSRLVLFSVSDGISDLYAACYRAHGFDAVSAGVTDAAALAAGRRDCSGKECVPYQLIWGGFKSHLTAHPPDKRTVLMQVSGEGMCRNCMFSIKDRISVERAGLADLVDVRHVLMNEPALGPAFLLRLWGVMVSWDLLFMLASWHRALEREEGEIDRIYEPLRDELVAIAEEPHGDGVRALLGFGRTLGRLTDLMDRAARAFAPIGRRAAGRRDLRSVVLTGDIYLRVDEFGSDHLIRRLAERGLQVLVEPASALSEYMAHERLSELMGLPKGRLEAGAIGLLTRPLRRALFAKVQAHHAWLPMPDLGGVLDQARTVLDRYPQGEAPMAIGTAMHAWAEGHCDGVVVVSPWGCGPALVAESLLRHQRDIPILYVYCDGSPVDERRLNGFAFRLRRDPPRRTPASARPAVAVG